ncbi:ribonuclease P 40kDa subunit-domain-containing protein [Neohortaea acidophila]|uniref:Ribonuclease P 40kDa subunit-domain-containing protein n=1 Tax=Neohortaea acidophila TaxID=245834 RepID=A0A6A6PYR2_9PEZI|nr:ribonuclease P 40kDa subunit-domain-containing protein [Neohortaea acidophila]KAF2484347.1 ribonuclease P 40kDa subunit-domain-containing protein [Neohortaea acidophila]
MFLLNKDEKSPPKCYFTSSSLAAYIDHAQIPRKKKPFSTILAHTFTHTLDIALPNPSAETLQKVLSNAKDGTLHFAKVYLKLEDILTGDFFNAYIKTGNILMLSEGRPGVDPVFSLSDGILRLEIDRPTFERVGLEGKPIPSAGRKHIKVRYAVELNLRLPSMVRGKPGFERVLWAARNVLNHSLAWVFCNLREPNDSAGPIAQHQPVWKTSQPQVETLRNVLIPPFPDHVSENDHETAEELLEWLSLVNILSPRVQKGDNVDPAISRYEVPTTSNESAEGSTRDLVRLRWRGFMPSAFIEKLLLATLKSVGEDWYAIAARSFDGQAYTILQNGSHTMTWEYQG